MGGCTGHPGVLDGSDVNPAGTERVSRPTVFTTDKTERIHSVWQWEPYSWCVLGVFLLIDKCAYQ